MSFSIKKGISLTGGSRTGVPKKPISPRKYSVIANVFNERLDTLQLGDTTKDVRAKRLNVLIKSAISNISKKNEATEHGLTIDAPKKTNFDDEEKNE